MNPELIAITRQLASVLLISAPQFAPNSVGARTVAIAKNINPIIEDLQKKEKANEKKH